MFEKPQALRLAAYLGMVVVLCYLVIGVRATIAIAFVDPFASVNWEQQIQQAANAFRSRFFAGGLLLVIHIFAGIFFLALTAMAAKTHPTTGTIGGGLLLSAVGVSFVHRIWEVFGADLLAVRYVSLREGEIRTALLQAYQLNAAVESLLIAVAISISIPGFLVMAYALTGCCRGKWLSVSAAFALAGATQFLAILAIGLAFAQARFEQAMNTLLVVLAALGAWAAPVLALGLAVFWMLKRTTESAMPSE